jgi:hypothetical protein
MTSLRRRLRRRFFKEVEPRVMVMGRMLLFMRRRAE